MSIFSMVFAVDGEEIKVVPGETLPVDPGDEVRLVEVSLCVGRFSSTPGEVCVDLAPVTVENEVLSSLHAGTHMRGIVADLVTLSGPDMSWTIQENWVGFEFVVNHWPEVLTEDLDCGDGKCEHDDFLTLIFE
jgi:hypothetical protein